MSELPGLGVLDAAVPTWLRAMTWTCFLFNLCSFLFSFAGSVVLVQEADHLFEAILFALMFPTLLLPTAVALAAIVRFAKIEILHVFGIGLTIVYGLPLGVGCVVTVLVACGST
ncbi:MAG: hypothetical protein AAGF12_20760 [Myxococcota bacterium]